MDWVRFVITILGPILDAITKIESLLPHGYGGVKKAIVMRALVAAREAPKTGVDEQAIANEIISRVIDSSVGELNKATKPAPAPSTAGR